MVEQEQASARLIDRQHASACRESEREELLFDAITTLQSWRGWAWGSLRRTGFVEAVTRVEGRSRRGSE